MKDDLISRGDALAVVMYGTDKVEGIKNLPAADAVEVVHGRWIWDKRFADYVCSECHNWDLKTPNYCPNCGARMDGE